MVLSFHHACLTLAPVALTAPGRSVAVPQEGVSNLSGPVEFMLEGLDPAEPVWMSVSVHARCCGQYSRDRQADVGDEENRPAAKTVRHDLRGEGIVAGVGPTPPVARSSVD